MVRRTALRTCVYCLVDLPATELTIDHVIGRSWFPSERSSVAKWKAPACKRCNNRYSFAEGDVLGRVALCLDPNDPALSGIVEKAKRAIDPKYATSERDRVRRLKRREEIGRSVMDVHDPHGQGVLPSFRGNFLEGSRTGIRIPARALEGVVEKWIRGVHYCEFGRPVPADYGVSAQFVNDEDAAKAFGEVVQHAQHIQKGSGVEVLIFHAEENSEFIAYYAFTIWKKLKVYGVVERAIAREEQSL